ncbi:unnamed protein product, partial [Prorocentrum cordatum]
MRRAAPPQDLLTQAARRTFEVAYGESRSRRGQLAATAQLRTTGLQGSAVVGGLREAELGPAAMEVALAALQNAAPLAMGPEGGPAGDRPPAAGGASWRGQAATKHWGELVYSWSPLPIGLIVVFAASPMEQEDGAQ